MCTKKINILCKYIFNHSLKFFVVSIICFVYSNQSFATITQIHDTNKCHNLACFEVTGVISQTDLKELANAVEFMKTSKAKPLFRLNSYGGDVEVAIAIGRQLRKFEATAITWSDGECYSSCVFILAGAVRRGLSTTIGIHRPYSSRTDNRDYQAIQADQRRISKLAKEYLVEVNVSPTLYDAMVNIPSEKIKLLSESELESYGLLKIDPVAQEMDDAADARRYGISKGEYLRRKAQVNITCETDNMRGRYTGNFDNYFKCRSDVLSARR